LRCALVGFTFAWHGGVDGNEDCFYAEGTGAVE
jgi:hypothetical protein